MVELFIILLIALAVVMLVCSVISYRKKARCSSYICKLLAAAIVGSVCYAFFLCSRTFKSASLFNGLFFAATDWLSLFMLEYALVFTEQWDWPRRSPWWRYALVIADTCSCVLNVFVGHMFTLTQAGTFSSGMVCWSTEFHFMQYPHLLLCYVLAFRAVAVLLEKWRCMPKLYKPKYMAIVIPFVAVLAINGFCYTQNTAIDYSVSLYGFLAVIICYYSLFAIPRELIQSTSNCMIQINERGLFYVDLAHRCIYANPEARKWFGIADNEKLQVIDEYVHSWYEAHKDVQMDRMKWSETKAIDGVTHYYEISFQRIRAEHNTSVAAFFIIQDCTEQVLRLKEEEFRARHDSLTGLYNREGFFEVARSQLDGDLNKQYYILASNVKDFKLINSLFGSEMGDRVLRKQAELIRKYAKDGNISARIAGDHFAMCMPKERFDPQIFIHCVNEINKLFDHQHYKIHYHIGVYEVTDPRESVENMYDRANMAIEKFRGNYEQIIVYYAKDYLEHLLY